MHDGVFGYTVSAELVSSTVTFLVGVSGAQQFRRNTVAAIQPLCCVALWLVCSTSLSLSFARSLCLSVSVSGAHVVTRR